MRKLEAGAETVADIQPRPEGELDRALAVGTVRSGISCIVWKRRQ